MIERPFLLSLLSLQKLSGMALVSLLVLASVLFLILADSFSPIFIAIIGVATCFGLGAVIIAFWKIIVYPGRHSADLSEFKYALPQAWADFIENKDGSVSELRESHINLSSFIPESEQLSLLNLFKSDASSLDKINRMRVSAQRGFSTSDEICLAAFNDGKSVIWFKVSAALETNSEKIYWRLEEATEFNNYLNELYSEQQMLASILDDAPLGICQLREDGRFAFLNLSLAEWLGCTRETLIDDGASFGDFVIDESYLKEIRETLFEDREGREILLRKSSGEAFPVLVQHTRIYNEDGHSTGIRCVIREVSGERELKATLHQAEEGFRRFFDYAPVGIVMVDSQGQIVETNSAFCTMVGMGSSIIRMPMITELIVEEDRGLLEAEFNGLNAGEIPRVPLEIRLNGPSARIVQMYARKAGDVVALDSDFIIYIIDTTDQKNLETQFAQSQKMQAVGQLAGGIAHDFNNLLTAIIGYSDLLLQRYSVTDQSFGDIMQIKQNANRAANLVRQLLAFSRRQTLQPKVLIVSDVLAELSNLLRRLLGENIQLDLVLARDVGLVKVDQGQFEQVIINLAVNARDAMPNGGVLTIRTRDSVVGPDTHTGQESLAPGHYVLVEVIDGGVGIPAANLDKIFEPFFTTKEVGAGVGLGLSTVYGILKQTGGAVVPSSESGKGTTFRVFLPQYEKADGESVTSIDSEHGYPRDLTGKGTILIVEDETPVRLFAARALENKGYNVIQFDSAEAVLEFLGDNDQHIDIVITDVVMPNMDGPSLIKYLHPIRPNMKVIFISGYAEEAFNQNLDFNIPFAFLAKPFNLKELAYKVKEVMED